MVYCTARSLALVALIVPLLNCGRKRHEGVVEGNPLPASIVSALGDANAPLLLWVLNEQDCLGCTAGISAAVVRRLGQRFGADLRTTVLLVGDDSVMVRNVLRFERVDTRIVLAPREIQAQPGSTPMLALIHPSQVVRVAHLGSGWI